MQFVHLRSSKRPVEYAVMLRVLSEGRYRTIHLFDNAHEESEHHEHAYVGFEKQQPPVATWRGDWRRAMAAALIKVEADWVDILDDWKARS